MSKNIKINNILQKINDFKNETDITKQSTMYKDINNMYNELKTIEQDKPTNAFTILKKKAQPVKIAIASSDRS